MLDPLYEIVDKYNDKASKAKTFEEFRYWKIKADEAWKQKNPSAECNTEQSIYMSWGAYGDPEYYPSQNQVLDIYSNKRWNEWQKLHDITPKEKKSFESVMKKLKQPLSKPQSMIK